MLVRISEIKLAYEYLLPNTNRWGLFFSILLTGSPALPSGDCRIMAPLSCMLFSPLNLSVAGARQVRVKDRHEDEEARTHIPIEAAPGAAD